jgi:hypothetical protein
VITMASDVSALQQAMASCIAWLYLLVNSGRVVSYLPQIVALWQCRDGARAISLLTWSYWTLSHVSAVLYGAVVIHDGFVVAISLLNLFCCGLVIALALRRRAAHPTAPAV